MSKNMCIKGGKENWRELFKEFKPTFEVKTPALGHMLIDMDLGLYKTIPQNTYGHASTKRGFIDRLQKNPIWLYKSSKNKYWQQVKGKDLEAFEEIYATILIERIFLGGAGE